MFPLKHLPLKGNLCSPVAPSSVEGLGGEVAVEANIQLKEAPYSYARESKARSARDAWELHALSRQKQ